MLGLIPSATSPPQVRDKWDFGYAEQDRIVYYRENKSFHFVDTPCSKPMGRTVDFSEECSLPEDTLLHTVNIPLVGVAEQLSVLPTANPVFGNVRKYAYDELLKLANATGGAMMTKTFSELIWGYDALVLYPTLAPHPSAAP